MNSLPIPHDPVAERAIVATLLAMPERLDEAKVTPEDFLQQPERDVFQAIVAIDLTGEKPDAVAITRWLRERERSTQSRDLVIQALDEPVVGNLAACASSVRSRARQRAFLDALRRSVAAGSSPTVDVEKWIADAEATIYDLAQESDPRPAKDLAETTSDVLDLIARRSKGDVIDYARTSLSDLNRMINGWKLGRLNVIAARPGNGKTALLLQEAINFARQGYAVVFISIEMDRDELVERALSHLSGVDNVHMATGRMSETEWGSATLAANELRRLPIAIVDDASVTVALVRSKVRRELTRLRKKHGNDLKLGAVMVDYMQRMHGPGEGEQVMAQISIGLAEFAKESGAAVIAAGQLSRAGRERSRTGTARPIMSDLRGSGQIEQDAYTIVFIHNEHSHLPRNEQTTDRILIVDKVRGGGRTGDVHVNYVGPITKFEVSAHESHDDLGDFEEGNWR